jgi:hypothetical protein
VPASGWITTAAWRQTRRTGSLSAVRSVRPDEFVDDWRDGFYNGHYDWPACLALLGEVAAKDRLGRACGFRVCTPTSCWRAESGSSGSTSAIEAGSPVKGRSTAACAIMRKVNDAGDIGGWLVQSLRPPIGVGRAVTT